MSRYLRIVIGLGLIGYAIYSGNAWFYLGVIPLAIGMMNWCPLEKMLGGCKDGTCSDGSCCTPKATQTKQSSCCSVPSQSDETGKVSSWSTAIEEKSCCNSDVISIKVLGTGCGSCIALKKNVDEAVTKVEKKCNVQKVEDIQEIMDYKVMAMPGLVINEEVISTGKLLSVDELIELINNTNATCC